MNRELSTTTKKAHAAEKDLGRKEEQLRAESREASRLRTELNKTKEKLKKCHIKINDQNRRINNYNSKGSPDFGYTNFDVEKSEVRALKDNPFKGFF